MKFLIADDSGNKIELMSLMLHHFGWKDTPLIAMTCEKAMDLIDTENITHAFVDYYIPTQDGPAIITYLKAKNPSAHIALVSSSDKRENFDKARTAGAESCICTSYAADEVEKAFGEVLERWKDSEEAKELRL